MLADRGTDPARPIGDSDAAAGIDRPGIRRPQEKVCCSGVPPQEQTPGALDERPLCLRGRESI
jgi:hypothetical protein